MDSNSLCHSAVYAYDGVNRLTGATIKNCSSQNLWSQSYSYNGDASNNLYGNMSRTPAGPGCVNFSFSAATNRITTSGYNYDAAGNVIGDGMNTYQWDAEGRLSKVVNGHSVAISTNTYNALGQRVRDQGDGVYNPTTTDELYGAGGDLLWRYTGIANDPNDRRFVPFVGRTLAEYSNGTPATIFDHRDEIGSNTVSTDYTGNSFNEKLFYPFGEFWTGYAIPSFNMQQTFAQLPDYDPETDQYNTANRHYSPMGRWLSPDPDNIGADPGDPQTWNMYAYVRNNPTTLTDPTGLDFMIACTQQSATCGSVDGYQGLYQGATASTGENGELQFTATVVTQEGGDLQDQNGMSYGGYFDQSGVHLTSADGGVSGSGQFVEGTKETDLFGQGLYFGVEGKFIDACGGSCKARGSISDLIRGSVGRAEGALNQRSGFTTFFDRLSGAHDKGTQWMDSAGLDHVIAYSDPKSRNNGKTELHFEGSPVQGIDVIPHLAGAFKDLVDGSAAAHRAVVLP